MISSLVVVVAALATYRVTMLVTSDTITAPLRDRIIGRYVHRAHEITLSADARHPSTGGTWPFDWPFGERCRCGVEFVGDTWADVASDANGHVNPRQGEMTTGPWWLTLLDCAWCASVWISFPVAWSAWCFGDRGWWFVPALALAISGATGVISTFANPGH